MRRLLLVRIAGLALCTSALAGCSAFGGDTAPPAAASAADPTPMAADLTAAVLQAQALRASGDLEGATRILGQLMLAAPDDSRVVGEYGKLLVQKGSMADAVQFLRRAIELQPRDWTLYSALGVAYDQQNDHPNAKLAYEHGLALKPGEPALLNNYAMSRMLVGDTVAARTLLMQAQAAGASDPRIAQNIARLDAMAVPVAAPPVAAPPRAVAATPPLAPRPLVARNDFPPVAPPAKSATAAPLPITRGGSQVVMQDVPFDPLAGPVGRNAKPGKPAKPMAKPAKPAKPALRNVATNAPAKPPKTAKPVKPAKDRIPALRMTADASKP
ncbi:MAG: tetratricopeptide repeat protein [Rhizomicrobium sp.]